MIIYILDLDDQGLFDITLYINPGRNKRILTVRIYSGQLYILLVRYPKGTF